MIRSTDPDVIRPYLKDASQLTGGYATEVVFPENDEDVIQVLHDACRTKTPVTVAGNGTGLAGARVPFGGIVLSTERLGGIKKIHTAEGNGSYAVTGPAVTLKELQEAVSAKGLLYPPDPTEQNAFIGASVATNASGSRTFKYGPTRQWVKRLKIILSTGDILELQRGEFTADKDNRLFLRGSGRFFELKLPQYQIPGGKHSAGYYVTPGMSAIDLFIGSEGTLGVFTEIEITLIPQPQGLFSGIVFFPREDNAWRFANDIQKKSSKGRTSDRNEQISARAVEYFDFQSLMILRSAYPHIPEKARSAIFFEQEIQPDSKKNLKEQWFRMCQDYQALVDLSWFGQNAKEHAEFRVFRHAIPVMVNNILKHYRQTKIGTDFTVPSERLFDVLEFYRHVIKNSGLNYCIFGHIGDNHLHVNFLPQSDQEAGKCQRLYHQIAHQIIEWKGTVSAEHGVGKIKRDYLLAMYGLSGLREMFSIKKVLDPCLILGRGNIFPDEFFKNG